MTPKLDLSLLPPSALLHAAHALMDGVTKHGGVYDWRQDKPTARTYVAATMRHVLAWLDGEAEAPDSGVHHLGHAIASLAIILDAEECGTLVDDRPAKGGGAAVLARLNARVAAVTGDAA